MGILIGSLFGSPAFLGIIACVMNEIMKCCDSENFDCKKYYADICNCVSFCFKEFLKCCCCCFDIDNCGCKCDMVPNKLNIIIIDDYSYSDDLPKDVPEFVNEKYTDYSFSDDITKDEPEFVNDECTAYSYSDVPKDVPELIITKKYWHRLQL